MPGHRAYSLPLESMPRGPPKALELFSTLETLRDLPEFMVFFILPLSLNQIQSLGLKMEAKKGEIRVERADTIRMEPSV